jgi:hypothetical protein
MDVIFSNRGGDGKIADTFLIGKSEGQRIFTRLRLRRGEVKINLRNRA